MGIFRKNDLIKGGESHSYPYGFKVKAALASFTAQACNWRNACQCAVVQSIRQCQRKSF